MSVTQLETPHTPNPSVIAEQNDAFRRAQCLRTGDDIELKGRSVLSHALAHADPLLVRQAVRTVGLFNDFDPGNDPDGYHDMGAFNIGPDRIVFRIDLYEADSNLRWGAEQPDNPATTERVLTIMFVSDC